MDYLVFVNESTTHILKDVSEVILSTEGFNEHVRFLDRKGTVIAFYKLNSIEGFGIEPDRGGIV
jgi:hypothetical protein